MKKEPVIQWFLLSDDYGKTEGAGKELILGIFNRIVSATFPFRYQKMWLLLKYTSGTGEYETVVLIKNPKGEMLFESEKITFKLKSETSFHGVNINLMNFLFEEPGVYWMEAMLDGKLKARVPLYVELEERPDTGHKH